MIGFYTIIDSPIGEMLAVSDGEHLTGLYTKNHNKIANPQSLIEHLASSGQKKFGESGKSDVLRDDNAAPFPALRKQLKKYFLGELTEFDLPLKLQGTEFQQAVWYQLTQIPYGSTISYATLAARVGNVNASRAVGNANGKNPVSIIVPCHRVVGANGTLTGYAGGLDCKKALLELENLPVRNQLKMALT